MSSSPASEQDHPSVGVLLVNLGTPAQPTPRAVRRYLREFLLDPRVVEVPRPIWRLILELFILPFRPRRSAHAYQAIWTPGGSPLLVFTLGLAHGLAEELRRRGRADIRVECAMRYGQPSVSAGLSALKAAGVARLLVLPLYPQYSASTSASVFDAVAAVLSGWRHVPELCLMGDYHAHPSYVAAVASSIRNFWEQNGPGQFLLFSFHGLPARSRALGDPYYEQCLKTADLIAAALGLNSNSWKIAFQSRFGPAEWLKPYCTEVLAELPRQGVTEIDVVCPGFAVDCLETLEEIAISNRELFLQSGGTAYRYIPALNDSDQHIAAVADRLAPYVFRA